MTTACETYHRDAVLALPKEQLLLRVYETLLRQLDSAGNALAAGERATAGRAISRSLDIVTALRDALDHSNGAHCVPKLDQLYRTVSAWLLEANLAQSAQLVRSSRRVLATLKEGWDGAVDSLQ